VVLLLASFHSAEAQQQATKMYRIGFLVAPSQSFFTARMEGFRQGLRNLGYIEGKNIVIEYRYADAKLDQLPELALELVNLKVDLIVTASDAAILAVKKASPIIPIVFAATSDPVRSGFVSSLARPGGNITGLTNMSPDLGGKRLELLKEAFPKVTRVAFFWMPGGVSRANLPLTEMEAPARALGLKLQSLEVRSLDDFASAFETAKRESAQALTTAPQPLINNGCWTSRQRVGCRGSIRRVSSLRLAA
jgi:putative ABC transport system substrate-binding protein